ncbi:MAG: O-antigen ligase family protein [Sarcina sp.]
MSVYLGIFTIVTGISVRANAYSNIYVEGLDLNKIPTAFMYNPNNLATVIVIGIFIYYIYCEKFGTNKIFMLFNMGMALVVLIETESRSNFIALILGLLVCFVLKKDKKKYFKICIFSIILLFIGAKYSKAFIDILDKIGFNIANGSFNLVSAHDFSRFDNYFISIKLFFESLFFGVGAGNADYAIMLERSSGISTVHSFWFETLLNYGIIGSFVVVYVFIFLMKKVTVNRHDKIFIVFGGIISSFIISSFAASTIYSLPVTWIFLGYILAYIKMEGKKNESIVVN